jgi:hypothetical protein
MTRLIRLLPILGSIALVVAGAVREARAQATPPSRFFGSLTIDGAPAAWGTNVVAEINGRVCSIPKQWPGGPDVDYGVDAEASSTLSGCGFDDAPVFFRVGNRYANQVGSWTGAAFVRLDLTISGKAERPIMLRTDIGMQRLNSGCSNVVLSVPPGTPLWQVALSVSPPDSLRGIFRYQPETGAYAAFAPSTPEVMNDYTVVQGPSETVLICARPGVPPPLP